MWLNDGLGRCDIRRGTRIVGPRTVSDILILVSGNRPISVWTCLVVRLKQCLFDRSCVGAFSSDVRETTSWWILLLLSSVLQTILLTRGAVRFFDSEEMVLLSMFPRWLGVMILTLRVSS